MPSNPSMKALQIQRHSSSDPPTLKLIETTRPQPDSQTALVKIHYSAIQPSDRLNAKGGFSHVTFPRIPGRDYCGEIVDGPQSLIGQTVYGTGASLLGFETDGPHAEYCVMPANQLVTKPSALSPIQASTIGVPYTTAMLCLKRSRATKDDVVLVLGASGGVGTATMQVAKAMGCKRVLGAARGDSFEVNLVADPELKSVKELTSGKGVDVVVDTVGNIALMSAAITQLAVRGRYAYIAAPRGLGVDTRLELDILDAYRREIELVGCNTGLTTFEDVAGDLRRLAEWFDQGLLKTKSDEAFEVVKLDDAVEKGYAATGKRQVVISMD